MSSKQYTPPPKAVTDGTGMRIAIIQARFNHDVTDRLLEGALAGLQDHGIERKNIAIFLVPGSFEIPLVAQRAARTKRYDAIICVGAVIRGETAHFDIVAHQAAQGVAEVSRAENIPVIFGVLTTDTMEQAYARSQTGEQNTGWQAALSAIEMVHALNQVDRTTY